MLLLLQQQQQEQQQQSVEMSRNFIVINFIVKLYNSPNIQGRISSYGVETLVGKVTKLPQTTLSYTKFGVAVLDYYP